MDDLDAGWEVFRCEDGDEGGHFSDSFSRSYFRGFFGALFTESQVASWSCEYDM